MSIESIDFVAPTPELVNRTAISTLTTTFVRNDELPERRGDSLGDLPFSNYASEFYAALSLNGFELTAIKDQEAANVGSEVTDWLDRTADPQSVRIVHVLSHGIQGTRSNILYVAGKYGTTHANTALSEWLRRASDFANDATTLFLLDLCNAGEVIELDWDMILPVRARHAWVLASSESGAASYNARFTRAVTTVLKRLARAELDDIDASEPYVPLATIAREVDLELLRLAQLEDGYIQRMVGSRIGFFDQIPSLPFFKNPTYERAQEARKWRNGVDSALLPYLDSIDALIDPGHFISRARGLGPYPQPSTPSCFTGRRVQLKNLVEWLDGSPRRRLRVVTGSPGTGKSALLGVLVAAAHPDLRPSATWHILPQPPSVNFNLAAIHARQRDQREIRGSIVRQLRYHDVAVSSDGALLFEIKETIKRTGIVPIIVIDALDEAIDPPATHAFLMELSDICRVMVGMRRWSEFGPLLEKATVSSSLIDLDQVDADEMRKDIRDYVTKLLAVSPKYSEVKHSAVRKALATGVASVLTSQRSQFVGGKWGEYLVAGLFVNHLLQVGPSISDVQSARQKALTVPTTLPEVFELDLQTFDAGEAVRSVLLAVALSRGQGMPAALLQAVAGELDHCPDLAAEVVKSALDRTRFYLRTQVDVDGTTLYRLFHQGLNDHLLRGTTASAAALFHSLIETVPTQGSGGRRWDLARPYVWRHLAEHAASAGRLGALLSDSDFIVYSEPVGLLRAMADSPSVVGTDIAAVYRTSQMQPRARQDPELRRDFLIIDSVRHGQDSLAASLRISPNRHVRSWNVLWASDGGASAFLRHALPTGRRINQLAFAKSADGTLVLITLQRGNMATHALIWDVQNGSLRYDLAAVNPRSVVVPDAAGQILTVGSHVQVWNVEDGSLHHEFDQVASSHSAACFSLNGRWRAPKIPDSCLVG